MSKIIYENICDAFVNFYDENPKYLGSLHRAFVISYDNPSNAFVNSYDENSRYFGMLKLKIINSFLACNSGLKSRKNFEKLLAEDDLRHKKLKDNGLDLGITALRDSKEIMDALKEVRQCE